MNLSFQWAPLLPIYYPVLLAVASAGILLLAWRRRMPDLRARAVFFLLPILLILNPFIIRETRQPLPGKIVVVVDESPSQNIGARVVAAEQALAQLKSLPLGADPIILRAGAGMASKRSQNTSLFSELRDSLPGIPVAQVKGTIIITDGQVHDVPKDLGPLAKLAPFNVILTGKKNEFDRKVTLLEAPKYGLLNQEVTLRLRVDDDASKTPVTLTVRQDGKDVGRRDVVPGTVQEYTFKLDHPGQNIFDFSVPAAPSELTTANNAAAAIVNGIRDRMRVLLVSGMPHMGERAWRDLLKSDPSIDLIHFNILRTLNSIDVASSQEMSLIAFPVDDLFEKKINEFDLIIFDKYAQYGMLLPEYFSNIAHFVRGGGAFLLAMGPEETDGESLFDTALADVLPVSDAKAAENLLSGPYTPQLTGDGKTHSVTADLPSAAWGKWFTQIPVRAAKGQVLMTGIKDHPLLVLDKVGDGRVAVLASDNIWLWSKGIDGGGPYTELLRNTAHWLMKEPELEEGYIRTAVKGDTISVMARRQDSVTMTRPDGREEAVALTGQDKSWSTASVTAEQNGIYRFSGDGKEAFAVVGGGAGEELSDVRTTDEKLRTVVRKTGGKIVWYGEDPQFSASSLNFRSDGAYTVTGSSGAPLIPGWMAAALMFLGLTLVWRHEGRERTNA